MVTINLVCVGNLKENYLKEAVAEYSKRLSKFCKLNIFEVQESVYSKTSDTIIEKIKTEEAEKIKKYVKGHVVLLDVQGTQKTSEEFANYLEKQTLTTSEITFIIGGSHGVSKEIFNLANFRFSFSKLTFPHQLMRVMLLEQIYRAFTINNNITYHK